MPDSYCNLFYSTCPTCGEILTSAGCGCNRYKWQGTVIVQGASVLPAGWICPICGRGVAPFADSCPCATDPKLQKCRYS